MSSPLRILTIDEINNKSITVTIDGEFLGNEDFFVYKISDRSQSILVKGVEDSVSLDSNKKVVVPVNEEDRFETGIGYTLKISRGAEFETQDFTVGNFAPPNYVVVKSYGDRIINVQFTTPIKNLDYNVFNPAFSSRELNNFYLLYFGLDSNAELNDNSLWFGALRVDPNGTDSDAQIFARVSKDYKSLEIQYNGRGIPTGNQQIVINYSKSQVSDQDHPLTDFSDEYREVPIMNKEFEVIKDDDASEPIDCRALSRTEVIVTYSKPVVLYPEEYKNVLYANGVRLKVENVTRCGNEFRELKFELNNTTPLNVSFADIKIANSGTNDRIDRVIDANGYKTSEKEFLGISVPSVPPRIINLIEEESNDLSKTKLIAYWSEDMNSASVENKDNYKLSNFNNQSFDILDLIYNEQDKSLQIILEKIDAAKYVFSAKNAEDVLGEVMNPQEIEIIIEDKTVPKVQKIVFRDKSFVIKYDDRMSIIGEHSALKSSNYRIQDKASEKTVEVADVISQSFAMNNNKWIRFTLKDNSQILPYRKEDTNYLLNIGYPRIKEIRYVEDVSKNIYPLCDKRTFNEQYEEFDIAFANKKIISDSQLILTYTENNELYDVSAYDFVFQGDITPLSARKVDWKTIEFNFSPGTFNGNITTIDISTISSPKSQDIFGYPIKGEATNNKPALNGLSPELKGVSLVNKEDNNGIFNVKLRFVFSKFMRIFKTDDIKITLNNSQVPLTIPNDPTPVDLKADASASIYDILVNVPYSISLSDVFMISLVDTNYIQSKDVTGNTLAPFAPTVADKFIASGLVWNKGINTDLTNNSIEIMYNKQINPGSIFDGWDGITPKTIAIGELQFKKDTDDKSTMSITELNNNFGKVTIFTDSGRTPVFVVGAADTTVTNAEDVDVTLINGNRLRLTFRDTETVAVNPQAAIFAEYIGNSNIVNETEKVHLYEGYRPTHIFQNTEEV